MLHENVVFANSLAGHGHGHHNKHGHHGEHMSHMDHFKNKVNDIADSMWSQIAEYKEFTNSEDFSVVFTDQIAEIKGRFFETIVIEEDGHDGEAHTVWVEIFGDDQNEMAMPTHTKRPTFWGAVERIEDKYEAFVYHVDMKLNAIAQKIKNKVDHKKKKLAKLFHKYAPVIRALVHKFYLDHQEQIDSARDIALGYYENYTEYVVETKLSIAALGQDYYNHYCSEETTDANTVVRAIVCSDKGEKAVTYLTDKISKHAFHKFDHMVKVLTHLVDADEAKAQSERIMAEITEVVNAKEEWFNALY